MDNLKKDMDYSYNLGLRYKYVKNRFPNKKAILWGCEEYISFADLDNTSTQIANYLLRNYCKKADVVAIQNNKSKLGYSCMLACLKIGAIYTNFDFTNPRERIARMFDTAKPKMVFADERNDEILNLCSDLQIEYVVATEVIDEIESQPCEIDERIITSVSQCDPAYIMFTSGSTGVPKGVVITHGSLMNFISWGRETYQLKENDVFTSVNPIYFDNSVFDFYCSVFNGISMLAIPKTIADNPKRMISLVDSVVCTVWFSVPSMLIYLTNLKLIGTDTLQSIRIFAFGGEGYPKELLRKLYAVYGNQAVFYNVYGPTEGTCICSAYQVSEEDISAEGLAPLGRLAPNFNYLILDEKDSSSDCGELCLIGTQLALGYYNDLERTEKSFVRNPLQNAYYERMYRTGDLVEEIDGLLYFRGRVDNQIKHMGYRIELEEIEAALVKIQGVKQCAVVHSLSKNNLSKLIGYVATDISMDESRIKTELKKYIPKYMIPNEFVFLDELPKNANGKVDRRNLKYYGSS